MNKRLVVTGMGAVTPLGAGVSEYWKNLIAGRCAVDFITKADTSNIPVKVAAEVKSFDPSSVLSIMAVVVDKRGILSDILRIISSVDCSVLTINQSVPTDGIANIHVTIRTDLMKISVDRLITELNKVSGVRNVKILAKQ